MLVFVYGPTRHQWVQEFLEELQIKCLRLVLPVVLGRDFNLIRKATDKNSSRVNYSLIFFNDFIATNKPREIKRGGLRFT